MEYASGTSDDASTTPGPGRPVGVAWALAVALAATAAYPVASAELARRQAARRLAMATAQPVQSLCTTSPDLDPVLSMRVAQLGPVLASWQTVGGCGAGGGGAGAGVKWIGRNTRGGLFSVLSQSSYVRLPRELGKTNGGYNLISTNQFGREINDRVSIGLVIPVLYKYYRNYFDLTERPVDLSNGGLGDINLVSTLRLGPIGATSVTAGLGFPTGEHTGQYKMDYLTQEKQLGLGKYTGTLTVDHVFDQIWGLMVVGGSLAHRGGENELASYRSPSLSTYSHVGYFLGPFVPACGLTLTGFLHKDRDRGTVQGTAVATAAASASIEWSNDYMALLAGISLPYGMNHWSSPPSVVGVTPTPRFASQPWIAAVGISLSPF
jgi:hypothetical protein